jgi:hypothetical protein
MHSAHAKAMCWYCAEMRPETASLTLPMEACMCETTYSAVSPAADVPPAG